jgi:hypothetical protein
MSEVPGTRLGGEGDRLMTLERSSGLDALERRVARLTAAVIGLSIFWLATVGWAVLRRPAMPSVLTVERLEIREPDGNLAFAFAGSAHPTAGTIDGEVLLSDQIEDRRFPHFIYFDGRGDEAGGLMLRTVDGPDGPTIARFMTFDGYKHQETITLGHRESAKGSVSGLRVISHVPGATLVGAMGELGVAPGATRAELQSALQALPPDERERILPRLTGATRVEVGTALGGNAGLTLSDAAGRPRVILEAPGDGQPSLRFLDENGETVLRVPE